MNSKLKIICAFLPTLIVLILLCSTGVYVAYKIDNVEETTELDQQNVTDRNESEIIMAFMPFGVNIDQPVLTNVADTPKICPDGFRLYNRRDCRRKFLNENDDEVEEN